MHRLPRQETEAARLELQRHEVAEAGINSLLLAGSLCGELSAKQTWTHQRHRARSSPETRCRAISSMNTFGFRFVAEDQAVAQAGMGDGLHVGGRWWCHGRRARLWHGRHGRGRGCHADSRRTLYPLRELRVSKVPGAAGGGNECDDVFFNRLGNLHGEHFLAGVEDGLRRDLAVCGGRGAGVFTTDEAQNFAFVVIARIADDDMQKKRSSCASGSGYVPSCSMGFCVARTRNGSASL